MVSRSSWHGDRHGDYGVWRRRYDWLTTRDDANEKFLQSRQCGRLANLCSACRHLFCVYVVRRIWLPRATYWLEARQLDAAAGCAK